ncbi:universal stress protein [Streptomyces zhihengii]
MTRIVTVGIDGSRESLAAAGWAAGEAVARGELLRMVHVWSNHAVAVTRYEEPETHRRRAHGLLDSAARYALADRPGLRLETSLLSGDPVRELCAAGAEADLLVLGSRGWAGSPASSPARSPWPCWRTPGVRWCWSGPGNRRRPRRRTPRTARWSWGSACPRTTR